MTTLNNICWATIFSLWLASRIDTRATQPKTTINWDEKKNHENWRHIGNHLNVFEYPTFQFCRSVHKTFFLSLINLFNVWTANAGLARSMFSGAEQWTIPGCSHSRCMTCAITYLHICKGPFTQAILSRQLDAIFVAPKLHQVSNMFETPAISRRQIAVKIAPGLVWSCNFERNKNCIELLRQKSPV